MSMIADPPLFAWPRSLPAKNDAAITGSCVIGPAPTLLTFDHRLGTEANASRGPGLARGTVRRGPEGKALTGPSVRSQQGPPPAQACAPPGTGCRRARENRSPRHVGPPCALPLPPASSRAWGARGHRVLDCSLAAQSVARGREDPGARVRTPHHTTRRSGAQKFRAYVRTTSGRRGTGERGWRIVCVSSKERDNDDGILPPIIADVTTSSYATA
jgi:hypothetical protein